MTKECIAWARQFDWFIKAHGSTVVVKDIWYNAATGKLVEGVKSFDSIERLEEWAGI